MKEQLLRELFLSEAKIGKDSYQWTVNDGLQFSIHLNTDRNKAMKMWRTTNQGNWRFDKAIELNGRTLEEIAIEEWKNFSYDNWK